MLIHEYPPVGGGGGSAAQDICLGLVERGHELTILTAHLKGLPKEEIVDRIRVLRLPSLRREAFRADFLAMAAYVLSGLLAGFRLIKRWQPDVIHVHFAVPAGAVGYVLSKLTGVPYLMTVHLGDVPGGAPEKTRKWFKWILPFTRPIWRDANRVVAVSKFTRQLALKHYPREMALIPNGVDLARMRPASIKVNEPPRIVFAGRFMKQKNPVKIVHTLAGLKDLSWECVMIGDGPLIPNVRREISEEGLQERFTLTGWIAPEEVLEWFDKSDILFMPSRSEGLPVVGVQALAKGLAMVVSDIGGFVDIVDKDRNGFLVGSSNLDGYVKGLQKLLSNQKLLKRYREASLVKATQFDILNVIDSYQNILSEVADG
ncbi:MAG: glycosyltransferase family 4 protein [Anaerolineae bacterium]|nr:glycosyltransferase family 4 protein [Anaerolineae bacterium]